MKNTLIAMTIAALATTSFVAPTTAAPIQQLNFETATVDTTSIHYKKKRHAHKRQQRAEVLSPRRIARKLHRQGYRDISRIKLRDGRYRVRAIGRRGPVKLIVHASSGKVLYRERIRNQRRHYRNYGHTYGGQRGGFSWSYTFR